MAAKTKLELTWIGKENRPRLEPRILIEDEALSYHASTRREDDQFDNLLIRGDNLLGLKALEASHAGAIKCIYIDPPYNTGEAFTHYDDGVEHSVWLGLMRDRIQLLHSLLRDDGVFFMQLNDEEMAYAKVLCDEIFNRSNYINQIAVKTKPVAGASGGGEDKRLKKNVEYILVYAKDMQKFGRFADVYEDEDLFDLIASMEEEGKSWKYTSIFEGGGQEIEKRIVKDGEGNPIEVTKFSSLNRATIKQKMRADEIDERQAYLKYFDGIFSDTNAQTSIRQRIIDEFVSLDEGEYLVANYIPRSGRDKGRRVYHYYVSESIRRVIWLKDSAERSSTSIVKKEKLGTLWSGISWNNVNKEGGVSFDGGKKPEELIRRILELATEPGDIVLDSFAGSGSTGAAAHKMGRRWIMIELGDHCETLIVPRLKRIIDGDDSNGISRAQNWKGGGGYRYYKLAPSLLEKDQFDHWVISKSYNAEMLAEAMCKHFGFAYAPSTEHYWMHGHSSETDFIYVTTNSLTHEQLAAISDEVGPERSLLICCKAFQSVNADALGNLTIRKIPGAILDRCEWAKDDYSLKIEALPFAEEPLEGRELALFSDEEVEA